MREMQLMTDAKFLNVLFIPFSERTPTKQKSLVCDALAVFSTNLLIARILRFHPDLNHRQNFIVFQIKTHTSIVLTLAL